MVRAILLGNARVTMAGQEHCVTRLSAHRAVTWLVLVFVLVLVFDSRSLPDFILAASWTRPSSSQLCFVWSLTLFNMFGGLMSTISQQLLIILTQI